jgi:tight adherence protein B
VPNLIWILLILTGVISTLSLLWFSFRLVDYYVGPKERRIKTRMANLASESGGSAQTIFTQEHVASTRIAMIANLQEAKFIKWLEHLISKSGISIGVGPFISLSVTLALFLFVLIYALFSSVSFAFLLGCIGSVFPFAALKVFIHRRQLLLERELPDLLDFMARSLQVGHSFNTTLQMAADEAPMPLSAEFRHVFDELNFGAPIQKVLSDLSDRIDCAEIRYFVIAVIVNREIGGDLAEILKRVSKLIRDRMEFRQVIRVLSSEGKASALILGGLPFLVGGLIFTMNPESLTLMLNDPLGRDLFLYAGILMALGFVWMNRLCEVKA